jgi:hypothetical protein
MNLVTGAPLLMNNCRKMLSSGIQHRVVRQKQILRLLTMVYNTQNYWVFGLCPSSGILGTRKHKVSEIGSVLR